MSVILVTTLSVAAFVAVYGAPMLDVGPHETLGKHYQTSIPDVEIISPPIFRKIGDYANYQDARKARKMHEVEAIFGAISGKQQRSAEKVKIAFAEVSRPRNQRVKKVTAHFPLGTAIRKDPPASSTSGPPHSSSQPPPPSQQPAPFRTDEHVSGLGAPQLGNVKEEISEQAPAGQNVKAQEGQGEPYSNSVPLHVVHPSNSYYHDVNNPKIDNLRPWEQFVNHVSDWITSPRPSDSSKEHKEWHRVWLDHLLRVHDARDAEQPRPPLPTEQPFVRIKNEKKFRLTATDRENSDLDFEAHMRKSITGAHQWSVAKQLNRLRGNIRRHEYEALGVPYDSRSKTKQLKPVQTTTFKKPAIKRPRKGKDTVESGASYALMANSYEAAPNYQEYKARSVQ